MISIIPLSRLASRWRVTQDGFPSELASFVDYVVKLGINGLPKYKKSYVNVEVHCVGVDRIQGLNRKYRKKNKPTDVLSFSCALLPPDIGIEQDLGDIFVCLPIIRQDADKLKIPFRNHLAHILIHGLLHLVGYDHESDEDKAKMQAKEVQILEVIQVPRPKWNDEVKDKIV
jgi:probable rRNA maturation factor